MNHLTGLPPSNQGLQCRVAHHLSKSNTRCSALYTIQQNLPLQVRREDVFLCFGEAFEINRILRHVNLLRQPEEALLLIQQFLKDRIFAALIPLNIYGSTLIKEQFCCAMFNVSYFKNICFHLSSSNNKRDYETIIAP